MKNIKSPNVTKLVLVLFSFIGSLYAGSDFYSQGFHYLGSDVEIDCLCRETTVGLLDEEETPDFSIDPTSQAMYWAMFAFDYDLDFNTDFLGYRTATYNCGSYVLYNSYTWVEDPSPWAVSSEYVGGKRATNCWILESLAPSGSTPTIFGGAAHICFIADEAGKCGNLFACKNNSKVYGPDFPTFKYVKL